MFYVLVCFSSHSRSSTICFLTIVRQSCFLKDTYYCNLYIVIIIKKNMHQMCSFIFIFMFFYCRRYIKKKSISYEYYIKQRIHKRSLIYDTTTWWFVNNNSVFVLLTQNTEFPIGIGLAAVHRTRQERT